MKTPKGNGQTAINNLPAKTYTKHATDFIAKFARFNSHDYAFAAYCVALLAAIVCTIGGALQ